MERIRRAAILSRWIAGASPAMTDTHFATPGDTVPPQGRVTSACAALFPPRRERVVEGALAGGALLDGDDGAALVDIDQRHVEPRALLQELQVALAVGIDIR